MTQRIEKVDGIKGFLIIMVVLGHFLEPFIGANHVIEHLYKGIYLFHMPAFIMLCGFFSKDYFDKKSAHNLLTNIIIPLIIFNILYELERYYLGNKSLWYLKIYAPNGIMWFLLSLFFWKILAPIFANIKQPVIWLILISISIKISSIETYTLAIGRTIHFAPFFIFGLMHKEIIEKILLWQSFLLKGLFVMTQRFLHNLSC